MIQNLLYDNRFSVLKFFFVLSFFIYHLEKDACVIMNSDGKWETKDCFFEFASFFCKLESTETPSSESFNCDPGWMSFGEFCYFHHHNIKV